MHSSLAPVKSGMRANCGRERARCPYSRCILARCALGRRRSRDSMKTRSKRARSHRSLAVKQRVRALLRACVSRMDVHG